MTSREEYMRTRYGGHLQRWVNRREQWLVRRMLAGLGELPAILDLPAGHGRFTPLLQEAARDRLVSADLNEDCAIARIDLTQPLPFADREFDLVFTFRYFQHVSDAALRDRILRELARVAGRHLLISYYGPAPLHSLEKHLWRAVTRRRGRTATARREEIARPLVACGFALVSDRAIFPLLHAQRVALFARSS